MPCTLLWFRNNLRLTDNRALHTAQAKGLPVVALYVFTPELTQQPRRAHFAYQCLQQLYHNLKPLGIPLYIQKGNAPTTVAEWAGRLKAHWIVAAESYAPTTRTEENQLWHSLSQQNSKLILVNDSVALARAEVMNSQGQAFNRFAPYQQAWHHTYPQTSSAQPQFTPPHSQPPLAMPSLPTPQQLGLTPQNLILEGGEHAAQQRWQHFIAQINTYPINRDFPAKRASSQLAPYLSFGALSARQLIQYAQHTTNEGAKTWLNALIWREFYQQFLYHHPKAASESHRPEYHQLAWQNHPQHLQRWQQGQTGYPIVDAAMRQLAQSGFIPHRLREIAAEFLVKDLLIDWRTGAAWFAQQLLDYDPAANIGNWQRIASVGSEALPANQVNDPVLQSQKYDPDGQYIRRFVPELAHLNSTTIHAPWRARESIHTNGYPPPIVAHHEQKAKALAMFQMAFSS